MFGTSERDVQDEEYLSCDVCEKMVDLEFEESVLMRDVCYYF